MLGVERTAVERLMTTADPTVRAGVVDYVDGAFADMPEHLRLGVLAESVLLTGLALVKGGGRLSPESVGSALGTFATAPIGLLRQYPRLLHSLVLFAELELAPEDRPGSRAGVEPTVEASEAS